MKTLKELINTTLVSGGALNNLSEKDYLNFYVDAPVAEEEVPELWKDVANELAGKIVKIDFDKHDNPNYHPFVACKKSLAREIGFDGITVYAYKGNIHEPWLESNFLAQVFPDENGNPAASLFIDIYDCKFLGYEELYGLIIQELFNFKRDIEWVEEGIYDEKLKEMENAR